MALGLGLTLGPVIGAISFEYLTFMNSMFMFSAVVGVGGVYSISLLPERIDRDKDLSVSLVSTPTGSAHSKHSKVIWKEGP